MSGIGTNLIGSDANTTTNVWSSVVYRGFGKVKEIAYGNGRKLAHTYSDQRQWLVNQSVTRTDGSDPIVNQTHTYYDDGRVAGVTDYLDTAYTASYTYDNYISDGLASVTIGGSYTRNYSYDFWGNMVSVVSNTEPSINYNYAANGSGAPATNRLQSVTTGGVTVNYGYDAAGNLTQEGALSYSYDAANRLKEVGTGGNNTYGYDGDGHRVKKIESGGGAIYYVWSSVTGEVALEINSQGGVYRAYVYAGMQVAGVLSYDGQFYWVHSDRLGSGRKMTDSSGAVRYRAEFDPFGQALLEWSNPSGVTNLNSHKFGTYERDEATGLDNAQARMYHSARGRFLQPDPVGVQSADLSNPQSLNRYAYVNNDPVNYADPSGTTPSSLLAAAHCMGGVLDDFFLPTNCTEPIRLPIPIPGPPDPREEPEPVVTCTVQIGARPIGIPVLGDSYDHTFVTVHQSDSPVTLIYHAFPEKNNGELDLVGKIESFEKGEKDYDLSHTPDGFMTEPVTFNAPCTDVYNNFKATNAAVNAKKIRYDYPNPATLVTNNINNSNAYAYTIVKEWIDKGGAIGLRYGSQVLDNFNRYYRRDAPGFGHHLPI